MASGRSCPSRAHPRRSAPPRKRARRPGTCSGMSDVRSSTEPCSSSSRRASRRGSGFSACSPVHTSPRRPRDGSGTTSATTYLRCRFHGSAEGDQISERALEEHLELHWTETPFARNGVELARREVHGWPCRQVFTPVNAIDLLGFEPAAKKVVGLRAQARTLSGSSGRPGQPLPRVDRRGAARQSRDGSRRDHRPEGRSEAPVRREGERASFTVGVRRSARGSAGRVRRARQPGEPSVIRAP